MSRNRYCRLLPDKNHATGTVVDFPADLAASDALGPQRTTRLVRSTRNPENYVRSLRNDSIFSSSLRPFFLSSCCPLNCLTGCHHSMYRDMFPQRISNKPRARSLKNALLFMVVLLARVAFRSRLRLKYVMISLAVKLKCQE